MLGYHRVSDSDWDPLNLAVSQENFRSQLETIAARTRPVSLRSLVGMQARGESLRRCVAVTFDDGCDHFAANAVPDLMKKEIPATVFVTTGYSGQPFWWDEISHLLRPRGGAIDRLVIEFGATGGSSVFENLADEKSAGEAVRQICERLLFVDPALRSAVIAKIREDTGSTDLIAGTPRAMTREQLGELGANPAVEIGAHTVTHPMLARLDVADQRREVQDSKSELERFGNEVTGFSYPNGSWSSRTCDLVEEAGFGYACTSRQAVVRRNSDRYCLPRIWVPDIGGRRFRHWLSTWAGFLR